MQGGMVNVNSWKNRKPYLHLQGVHTSTKMMSGSSGLHHLKQSRLLLHRLPTDIAFVIVQMAHPSAKSPLSVCQPETAFSHSIPLAHPQNWLGRTCRQSTSKRPRPPPRTLPLRAKYTPSEDDRAEQTSEVPTELTLAQQLLMKQYEEQIARMSTAECQKLCVEIARQMMVKDNIMRKMLKTDINFGIEPPDPDDFKTSEQAEK